VRRGAKKVRRGRKRDRRGAKKVRRERKKECRGTRKVRRGRTAAYREWGRGGSDAVKP
jgi:hypothetical protein